MTPLIDNDDVAPVITNGRHHRRPGGGLHEPGALTTLAPPVAYIYCAYRTDCLRCSCRPHGRVSDDQPDSIATTPTGKAMFQLSRMLAESSGPSFESASNQVSRVCVQRESNGGDRGSPLQLSGRFVRYAGRTRALSRLFGSKASVSVRFNVFWCPLRRFVCN
jgi:hypothetical protein